MLSAETGTHITSPPKSSTITSCSANCPLIFSIFAPSKSILLIAIIIGTEAFLAWLIDSIVCGIKPSSAATTSTTISVTLVPEILIDEKAS